MIDANLKNVIILVSYLYKFQLILVCKNTGDEISEAYGCQEYCDDKDVIIYESSDVTTKQKTWEKIPSSANHLVKHNTKEFISSLVDYRTTQNTRTLYSSTADHPQEPSTGNLATGSAEQTTGKLTENTGNLVTNSADKPAKPNKSTQKQKRNKRESKSD